MAHKNTARTLYNLNA